MTAIDVITIDKRFCGPKTSGNGGYVAGRIASAIDGPAAVMLKAPPPLNTPITLQHGEKGGVEAVLDGAVIATAKPASVEVNAPPLPDSESVAAAHDQFLAHDAPHHVLPYCFVCGPKREPGDGLRIFSGAAPDSPANADFWTPGDDLAGEDGLVAPEYLWAALDCPSFFALRKGVGGLSLLGRLAADVRRRPKPGERLTVLAWPTGQDGRKHFSDCALYDENGDVVAAANAVWIDINDPAFLEKLRAENA